MGRASLFLFLAAALLSCAGEEPGTVQLLMDGEHAADGGGVGGVVVVLAGARDEDGLLA